MHGDLNDMPYADGSRQGGFIYATSPNKDNVGGGQSFAGEIEESLDDGTRVSRLRAYGSMTYAGFKSLIYAKLRGDDPRVRAAQEWISRNYTLAENPGLGTDGMYYYYLAFARALDAFGQEQVPIAEGQETVMRDWANDLIDALAKLQNENGSFRSVDDRWMENDPVLITAYAVIALQHAAR
jgi:squalene-hopene/tetraprenyl-beta-curcumene cyclase